MSQTRPIINQNYNFERFTGGVPDDFTVAAGAGAVQELKRTDPRANIKRRFFPKKFKSSDYIFDGTSSFRWVAEVATQLQVDIVDLPVQPGMNLAPVFTYRVNADLDTLFLIITLKDGIGGATLGLVVKPTVPPLQVTSGGARAERDAPGMPASATLAAAGAITLGPQQRLYWERYGAQFTVPMGCYAIDARIQADSAAAPTETKFDLGEFRVEALDTLILAEGGL